MRSAILASCLILPQMPVTLHADDRSDSATARALVKQLENSDKKKRNEVIEQLSRLGNTAIPVLIEGLGNEDERVSDGCMSALHDMGARTLPALSRALTANESSVRQLAAIAMVGMQGDMKPAVVPLISALGHKDAKTRRSAIMALTFIGDTRALVPLSYALLDEDEAVQFEAVVAFENFGSDGRIALPTLILMLRDIPKKELPYDLGVNIKGALAQIGGPAVPSILYEMRRKDAPLELVQLFIAALDRMVQVHEKGA